MKNVTVFYKNLSLVVDFNYISGAVYVREYSTSGACEYYSYGSRSSFLEDWEGILSRCGLFFPV